MVGLELNQLTHAHEILLPGLIKSRELPDTRAVGLPLHHPKRLPLGSYHLSY